MAKSLFIKSFISLLLLIYGCRLIESSHSITYFRGKAWATAAPIRPTVEAALKRNQAGHVCSVTLSSIHSLQEVFDCTRPKSLANNKTRALFRKRYALPC
jgi:hypothetical protein